MEKIRNQSIKFGNTILIFENNKLKPQKLSKSVVAALFQRSRTAFSKELDKIKRKLKDCKDEKYEILVKDNYKKTFSSESLQILFEIFNEINREDVELLYSNIRKRILNNKKVYTHKKK